MTTQQDALQDLVRISEELGLYDGEFNDEGAGMKELTDEQIEHIAATEIPSWFTDSKVKRFARAIISVDRALNAPADLEHQSAGKPVAWLLTDKNINDIQVGSVQRLIDRARQAHFTDLIIRINGKDEHYQADWLKHLVRAEVPVCAPADRDVMRQVPEGWKLVPIEPTLDQYNSACRAYSDWQVQCQEEAREHEDERNPSWGYSQPHFTHSDVYRAMLAAAPTPPAEQYNERLFTVVASAYQILGALDAPAHILDVLSDPLGASDEQVEAMLPYVPAEQQPVAHFAVHTCPGGEFEYVQVESEGRGTIPLYTRPAPSLATLRAEVEGLRNVFSPPDYFPNKAVWLKEVLSLIDKLGDGV